MGGRVRGFRQRVAGSGKSVLAARLARELGWPLLSKDRIKEALAGAVRHRPLESKLGAIAMETLWALAARIRDAVIVESWWFAPRDRRFLARGVLTAGARAAPAHAPPVGARPTAPAPPTSFYAGLRGTNTRSSAQNLSTNTGAPLSR
jgi:AAA domain-containing protein